MPTFYRLPENITQIFTNRFGSRDKLGCQIISEHPNPKYFLVLACNCITTQAKIMSRDFR